jgi:hypothetical protein
MPKIVAFSLVCHGAMRAVAIIDIYVIARDLTFVEQ